MALATFIALGVANAALEANPPEELLRVVLARAAIETGRGRFCVSVNRSDPTNVLLRSVDPKGILLIPASECEYVGPKRERRAVEKNSARPAQFLRIEVLRFTPKGRATVDVGYRAGSWLGYGYIYNVMFESDQWHVTGFDSQWVE